MTIYYIHVVILHNITSVKNIEILISYKVNDNGYLQDLLLTNEYILLLILPEFIIKINSGPKVADMDEDADRLDP